jgi:hypothetical protein
MKKDIFRVSHLLKVILILSISGLFLLNVQSLITPQTHLSELINLMNQNKALLYFLTISCTGILFFLSKNNLIETNYNRKIFKWTNRVLYVLYGTISIFVIYAYTGSFVDEYYHIFGANSLIQNGELAKFTISNADYGYARGLIITYATTLSFYFFGSSIVSAKFVPFFFGLASFFICLAMFKHFIKDDLNKVIFLLIYIFSPFVIFNHFYIRMYSFYEFAILTLLLCHLFAIKFIRENDSVRTFVIFALISVLNIIFYSLSKDNGIWPTLLTSFILSTYIFLFEIRKLSINKTTNLGKMFASVIYSTILTKVVFLFLFLFTLYQINKAELAEKIHFFFNANLANAAKSGNFDQVFFGSFTLFTALVFSSVILIILIKNIYKKLIISITIFLFFLHYFSSSELQLTRGLLYFLPLFFLTASIGITEISKLFKVSIIPMIVVMYILITVSTYPTNFTSGPYLPGEVWYIDYKQAYDYVKTNHPNAVILAAVTQPFISEFYNVETTYFLNIYAIKSRTDYKTLYDEENKKFFYYNVTTIEDPAILKNVINTETNLCVIIRTPSKQVLLTDTIVDIIESSLPSVTKFKGMDIYCKNQPITS